MKCLVVLVICLGISSAWPTKQDTDPLNDPNWKAWKSFHNKNYDDEGEERVRNFIWQDNLKRINSHNEVHKYELAMNHLGDMTSQEVKEMLNGYKMTKNIKGADEKPSTFLAPANVKIPDSVDWRTEGYVTPVKNQGHCGSCWAFSTTGSLEGQHFRKTGKLISLSEQNLVDCSSSFGNNGCHGGLMDNAFKYIKSNDGVDTEDSYPYRAQVGTCHFNVSAVGATDTGFMDITSGDESALQAASASVGPISVAIDASHSSFQFYHKGVYDEPACSSTQLDHGVLVVGYGNEEGQDYWLIKNSWGPTWGEEGYIKIARNKDNKCGVATSASYPLV
ncbi:cathepsin L-like peptidase [Oculina patagonica]